jgi:hypothetical protein
VTAWGIHPATLRLAAKCRIHLRHRALQYYSTRNTNYADFYYASFDIFFVISPS